MVAGRKMRKVSALESSRVAAVAGSATEPSDRDLERAKCRPRVTERHMSDIVQEHPPRSPDEGRTREQAGGGGSKIDDRGRGDICFFRPDAE